MRLHTVQHPRDSGRHEHDGVADRKDLVAVLGAVGQRCLHPAVARNEPDRHFGVEAARGRQRAFQDLARPVRHLEHGPDTIRRVIVHLVDGTYELFRHFFAVPPARNDAGEEIGAVRGVVRSIVGMLEGGATHIGVATDHVIESFRNGLYPFYKTSAGVDPALLAQFQPLEDALRALGVTVWAMIEHEADDALATAARIASEDADIERAIICTPDKDLAQCVEGARVIQLDRRRRQERDEAGVIERFGVPPGSISDLLALVGDSADGYPGLPGWGAKTAAAVLARYGHIEAIPDRAADWDVRIRGIERLAATLAERRDEAMLYKDLATLRRDSAGVDGPAESWRWRGPGEGFEQMCARLDDEELPARVRALIARVG